MSDEIKNEKDGISPDMQPLNINGDIYYTRYTRKYINRKKWSKPDDRELLSFIPGTVREVFVKEGEEVHYGQKLMILEAMKMLNTIYSPVEGKIESINIKTGDRIPKGTLMMKFA